MPLPDELNIRPSRPRGILVRTCSFFVLRAPGPRACCAVVPLRVASSTRIQIRAYFRPLSYRPPSIHTYSRVVCSATGNEDHARGRNRNSRVPEFNTRQLTSTPPLAGTAMTTPGSTRVWDRLYVGRVIRCDCPRSEDHQHVPICSPLPHLRLTSASPLPRRRLIDTPGSSTRRR